MKIIVAGSRAFANIQFIHPILAATIQKSDVVLQGGARGVDRVAKVWCRSHGIACREVPAEWERFGKAAGPRRNEAMARDADALLAFWDGESPGTGHMITCMQRLGKPVRVVYIDAQHPDEAPLPTRKPYVSLLPLYHQRKA